MSETIGYPRSATETILRALEEFGTSEPKFFLAVWVDEAGDIAMCRTDVTNTTMQLGLLASAQMMIGAYLGNSIERENP